MAKQTASTPEKPSSVEQLAEVRRNFAFSEALERCKLARDGRPPKAEDIQILVQAWRQLRKAG